MCLPHGASSEVLHALTNNARAWAIPDTTMLDSAHSGSGLAQGLFTFLPMR